MDEGLISERVQTSLSEGSELKLDDATKIVGCYKALAKIGLKGQPIGGSETRQLPMRQALAFCQNIAASKMFADEFSRVVTDYTSNERIDDIHKSDLSVELQHVDGTFNAEQRNERLSWLEEDTGDNICRVLTNARCLSEGVDVPSLDAIMFVHPRKSQIDVVQSVGRVMRKAEGKNLGYVILPITVAAGITPERALNDNERYRVVWQILNALRTHDERFDSTINRIGLGEDVSDRIEIVGVGSQEELEATTAVVEDVKPKPKPKEEIGLEDVIGEEQADDESEDEPEQASFVLSDLSQAIKAKIVQKCGTRDYWENWATDIANIAQQHITRINAVLVNSGTPERAAFESFLEEIRDDLNPEITESDAVEMLAQHLITKPVFDTLFVGNKFTSENAVSRAMEKVLDYLHASNIDTETRSLEKFYKSVQRRAADIVTTSGRQTLILELYDRFFRNAFPRLTQRLGIVYTPTEIVDFIIESVNDVLREEFGESLGSKGVHILDPFTGTGTFIVRLLQSGHIQQGDLRRKYQEEIHANEIVLLAYYIAAINIESIYQEIAQEDEYHAFEGMVLTDTFQLYEQEKDVIANLLPDNSERRTKQKTHDITVIFGNPPYSAGQRSENDDAPNIQYSNLDSRIASTFIAESRNRQGKSKAYDSYIRAFRWALDRINDHGVVAFVSGNGWIDKNFADGMRSCVNSECSDTYIVNLRGDIRKNMLSKGAAREGENIFGQGSMTGIAISILVKNNNATENKIHYLDIGDDLSTVDKKRKLAESGSITRLLAREAFEEIQPNEKNTWINQGDENFANYVVVSDKSKKEAVKLFETHSIGILSNRDKWVFNFSENKLSQNIANAISFYNEEMKKFGGLKKEEVKAKVNKDKRLFSWTDDVVSDLAKKTKYEFDRSKIVTASYRPFTACKWYQDKRLNWSLHLMGRIFPNPTADNLGMVISGIGARSGFSVLMVNKIPEKQIIDNGQCLPLHTFEEVANDDLFAGDSASRGLTVNDGITDAGYAHFSNFYSEDVFDKEDVFYYVYGLLHSPDYRERFRNNLARELPRIPRVKRFDDFMLFSKAGRDLADLHVNYESVEPYFVNYKQGDLRLSNITDPRSFYRVEKMKFPKKTNKSVVFYNDNITMEGIPLDAYDYVISARPALEWVMERQCVKTDKASGIINDANDYANETMDNPAYPLELFQRVITVSLETMKIVKSLPKLDID